MSVLFNLIKKIYSDLNFHFLSLYYRNHLMRVRLQVQQFEGHRSKPFGQTQIIQKNFQHINQTNVVEILDDEDKLLGKLSLLRIF